MFKNLAIIICIMMATVSVSFAADWQRPWSEVKHKSAARCREVFDNYQLQAICMQNERDGYSNLQGNYDMPYTEALKAKERCQEIFDCQFQLQDICMQNESDGYKQMQNY